MNSEYVITQYQRHFKFKKDKLDDRDRLENIIAYLISKIVPKNAERIHGEFFLYDGDNFMKNLVTLQIKWEIKSKYEI